jgi:hypothetical protein
MEALELYDIDEDEIKGLLHHIPEVWKKNSSFFDTGLTLVFKSFGEHDNLLFGVHIFSHGNGAVMFIILTEYFRDSRIAVFNINARHITGWFSPSDHNKGEIKLRQILEGLTYEELEHYSIVGKHIDDDQIFICPNCRAQYMMRVLRVSDDGRIECQNCRRLFSIVEIDETKKHTSYDS